MEWWSLSFWKAMQVEEGELEEEDETEEGRVGGWELRRLKKGGEGERMWEVKKKQRRRRKVVLRKLFMLVVEREAIVVELRSLQEGDVGKKMKFCFEEGEEECGEQRRTERGVVMWFSLDSGGF